ncbi:MAG: hypothetical protein RIS64_3421, partial [Bacteroidota bacterium]
PAFPPLKSITSPQIINNEPVEYYLYIKNYRERSH